MNVEFNLEGENSVTERHIRKSDGAFIHKTAFNIKLLPFNTSWKSESYNDFVYFNGILGECFRLANNKKLPKSLSKKEDYNSKLKEFIIDNALSKIEGDNEQKVKELIEDLFFQENNLYCFNRETLPYLSFIKENAGLKEIAGFIYGIFFSDEIQETAIKSNDSKDNILYNLIKSALPKLENLSHQKKEYFIFNLEILELFKRDFNLLNENEEHFLKDIEKLIKFYYFYYVSQLANHLNSFCSDSKFETYFTLESEIISKSRNAYQRGWQQLEGRLDNLFSHVNALELLNYINVGNDKALSYIQFKKEYLNLSDGNKEKTISAINELISFYKSIPSTKPNLGWEECENQLIRKKDKFDCEFEKAVYELWFTIDFQFVNSGRKKYYESYRMWFTEFCKANFLKRRGRIGYTLRLSQEMLLFLTKTCIGKESKIRLKTLWIELEKRGVYFDEPTKVEVVRLFEKINLIEKKSDSGDAQYVRAIL